MKTIRLLFGLILGLGLSYGLMVAASGGDIMVREKVVVSLVSYLDKHPDSIVAHQLALWLVPSKQEVMQLGGAQQTNLQELQGIETRTNTVCFRDSAGARCLLSGWEEVTQAPGATTTIATPIDTLAATNPALVSSTITIGQKMNRVIYIDKAEIEVQGIVSSTFYAQMGTSTAQGGTFNLTPATAPSGLIQRTQFATSTSDVVFRTQYQNLVQSTSTYSINPTATNFGNFSGVKVTTSTFVVVSLYDQVIGAGGTVMCLNGGIGGYVAGSCEQVTSTNRGFTIRARYNWHAEKDI